MYYEECLELLEEICSGKLLGQEKIEENKKDVFNKIKDASVLVFCGMLKYIEPFLKCVSDKKIYFIDQAADEGLFLQKPVINWDDFEILIKKENVLAIILSRSGISFYSRMLRSFSENLPVIFYGKLMLAYPECFSEGGRFDYTPKGIRAAFEDIFFWGGVLRERVFGYFKQVRGFRIKRNPCKGFVVSGDF